MIFPANRRKCPLSRNRASANDKSPPEKAGSVHHLAIVLARFMQKDDVWVSFSAVCWL
jgi:hypothetical protein